ncbi:methylenetetrahydrofolate reductase [Buchnera aphidicola]|uniref:methylenetetrahydrofolate reductase n=1 Tax=Buchnera aphidicola TaxID=9 RepID=UPI0025438812|nr:methylenetetrahydrofolate reductase [Buchnera aphidicola]WII23717.1 methylenetetrahydrofolate reductase [Buchnera aphidicola (Sipha maydis)]
MNSLKELINIKNINLSFEFFPPLDIHKDKKFWNEIKKITYLQPKFMSVTYGANNGNKTRTFNFVQELKLYTKINIAPHMICVNEEIKTLKKLAMKYFRNDIKDIVALRGDCINKKNNAKIYARDLVILLKKIEDFNIFVAAYPEVHPEAKSFQFDLMNLKNKMDSGANQAITQFFFDIENFLRFRDKCVGIGIKKKIIPGILPIYDFNQVYKFCLISNIFVPTWLKKLYFNSDDSIKNDSCIGKDLAINMINTLYKEGVYDFHIYTLNKLNFINSIFGN